MTGNAIGVDLALTGARASTSGCEVANFAGLDFSGPNDIALIQRGGCTFTVKALNAEVAGAEAVIIFNQGDASAGDRFGLLVGTLGGPNVVDIPVVGASFAQGEALAAAGSTAQVLVDFVVRSSFNVIAELPGRNDDNVVMAGAHLDSVPEGPGINDNGSGSAALLEVAQATSKLRPENTLRFAWWGKEEGGLVGSTQWVAQQSQAELDRIARFINNGVPPAGSSPALRWSRPKSRRPSGVAPRVSSSTLPPPGLRHLRQQQRPRSLGQHRRGGVRGPDLRLLHRGRQRRCRREGSRQLHHPGACRSGAHLRRTARRSKHARPRARDFLSPAFESAPRHLRWRGALLVPVPAIDDARTGVTRVSRTRLHRARSIEVGRVRPEPRRWRPDSCPARLPSGLLLLQVGGQPA